MKKLTLIIGFMLLTFSFESIAQSTQTEEYAIVDVFEIRKKKIIRTTIGEEPATQKEWEVEKTDVTGDFSPVIKELNDLNKKGFKLLNTSTTYTTVGGGQTTMYGNPRFTFVMVKKIE